ncbi:MAG: hypothetical protein APR55_02710 [Methanolinea sp. SDB]|nr:MAG: hypothetical protein APR55_02710 [Methanolinea sp. SDB]
MIKIRHPAVRRTKRCIFLGLLALILVSFLLGVPGSAQVPEKETVLVILSYHPGMVLSDEELRGMRDSLVPLGDGADIRVEYMDTKRISDSGHLGNLYRVYAHKYRDIRVDAIITGDNSAFDFIREYRDDLFPGVPVVFCGINYFSTDMIQGMENITGVVQDNDVRSTLRVALEHFPGTQNIYVVHDNTDTGVAIHSQVTQFVPEFENGIKFTFLSNLTIAELLERAADLPKDSIILLEPFNRDSEGMVVTHEEIGDLLDARTDVPMYGNSEMNLGHGIIGGKITTGYSQGRLAGGMALRILQGEPASSIPVVTNSPNVYMFDHLKLREFGIDQATLPEGSIIINAPPEEKVPAWILYLVLVILGCMGILVILLAFHLRVRKRIESELRESIAEKKAAEDELVRKNEELNAAYQQLKAQEEELRENYRELKKRESELRESESRYRHVIEDQTEFICRFQRDGTILLANNAFCRYYGKSCSEIIGHRILLDIPDADRRLLRDHFASITPENPVKSIEHRILLPDGEVRWQQWTDRGIFGPGGEIIEYQSVGRDNTERKKAREAFALARKKLSVLNSVTFTDIKNTVFSLSAYLAYATDMESDPGIARILKKQEAMLAQIEHSLNLAQAYQEMGIRPPRWQDVNQAFLFALSHLDLDLISKISRDVRLDGLEIYADQLPEKVMSNLTDNVFRHGGSVSRISLYYQEVPDGIVLVFEDDGRGIASEDKEKIFQKEYGGGSRVLGLNLVREILGITGITIKETGDQGRGARFEMHVPKGAYRFRK